MSEDIDRERAEWNQWRGNVDAKLAALPEQLSAEVKHIGETLKLHLDAQDVKIGRIDAHTAATNGHVGDAIKEIADTKGRVAVLETDKARAEGVITGVRWSTRWFPILLSSVLTVAGTVTVMALAGGIHI